MSWFELQTLSTAVKMLRGWQHTFCNLRLLKLWYSKEKLFQQKWLDPSKTWIRAGPDPCPREEEQSFCWLTWTSDQHLKTSLRCLSFLTHDQIQASKSCLFLPLYFVTYTSLTSGSFWSNFRNPSDSFLCLLIQQKSLRILAQEDKAGTDISTYCIFSTSKVA